MTTKLFSTKHVPAFLQLCSINELSSFNMETGSDHRPRSNKLSKTNLLRTPSQSLNFHQWLKSRLLLRFSQLPRFCQLLRFCQSLKIRRLLRTRQSLRMCIILRLSQLL